MTHETFHDRGRPDEAASVGRRDAVLVEKIRSRASLREIAHAMAAKLEVDDPTLLDRIANLGVTLDTAAAFLLAPLVEIAWADGHVSEAERDAVFDFAVGRGVAPDSTDMAQLRHWLTADQPPLQVFECALDTIRLGLSALPEDEAQQRVTAMINACKAVARASGGLDRLLALPSVTSPQARSTLAEIRIRMGSA